ncbi:DUF3530 family protein [Marinomonas algarum]|uniref:Alpha/beta hydrolase family protein n=1 Tax=Marinomonas algarum TaxID=2883105 RepID=A0A9X1LC11_9GAMM|nr:DUF3530 family protein [Marinomonas algarum]MCB5161022.1 alpha/beta hydrolase family protein [Marinomonas algarum]
MHKINRQLALFGVLLGLFNSAGLLAENSTKESENTRIENNDYVMPQPQQTRISALKKSLANRQIDHQIQNLNAGDDRFLTLYQPPYTATNQGCVVILHADNQHPDWPDVIAPLRNALPNYSWCTLSVEIPDIIQRAQAVISSPSAEQADTEQTEANPIENTTNTDDGSRTSNDVPLDELPNQDLVFGRLQATLDQAQAQDIEQFVLLGYQTGASYALAFLAENPDTAQALIMIDVDVPENRDRQGMTRYRLAQRIRQVNQPTLDYYASKSGSEQFARWRQQAANQRGADGRHYQQWNALPTPISSHENKATLVQTVRGFLKQNTEQVDQKNTLPSAEKGLFY